MTITLITAVLMCAAIWSVLCRLSQMQHGVTQPLVFVQHLALGLGLACGLFLPMASSKLALAAGVLVYLLASAGRWRHGAPQGTETGPGQFDPDPWFAQSRERAE